MKISGRNSIYTLYGLTLLLVFGIFDFAFTRWDWLKAYREDFSRKVEKLNDETFVARTIYGADQDALVDYLESRRRNGAISAWILYQNDQVQRTSLPLEQAQKLELRESASDDEIFQIDANTYYSSEALSAIDVEQLSEKRSAKTRLVLMLIYNESLFLKKQIELGWATLLKYIFGILSLAILTFAFYFREIARLIRRFREGHQQRPESLQKLADQSLTHEAQILGLGLWANQMDRRSSESEKEILRAQVLPSFRRELQSGKTPPYQFRCTLVRTDINNFTKIYNQQASKDQFTQVIDEFFLRTSLLVTRYGGYVHQFVGDEILYYFKDEESEDSCQIALACLRDVGKVAEGISGRCQRDFGYEFTIKSSLANDEMSFAPFVHGYSIAGPSLIETVRILSLVEDRSQNSVVFESRHNWNLKNLASLRHWKKVSLKGFSSEFNLYQVEEFLLPQTLNPTYHRTDQELVKIINTARINLMSDESSSLFQIELFRIAKNLNGLILPDSDGNPAREIFQFIFDTKNCLTNPLKDRNSQALDSMYQKILSNFLSALKGLVSRNILQEEKFRTELEEVLNIGLTSQNPRIVANALETKSQLFPSWTVESRFLDSANGRVRANALVALALSDIKKALARLSKDLLAKDQSVRKSSLWALQQISDHLKRTNPVQFSTNMELQALLKTIQPFRASLNSAGSGTLKKAV